MKNKIILILFLLFIVLLSCLCGCASDKNSTMGTLDIVSSPRGAEVYLDNVYIGTTPVKKIGIPPGNHSIELRLNGFEPWTASGTLEEGESEQLEASLVPISSPTPLPPPVPVTTMAPSPPAFTTPESIQEGSLIVASSPSYANVYIDSVYRGRTPLTLMNIPVGTYEIVISNAGYENWTGEAKVSWVSTTKISANLTVIPPTVTTPPPTPAPWTPPPGTYIILHPIGDVSGGSVIEITGTTNFEDMTPIYMDVRDPQGVQVVSGTATVINGGFSFYVDTHTLPRQRYSVEAWAFGVTATQYFNNLR